MKPLYHTLLFSCLLAAVWGDPSPYIYNVPKTSKQVAFARGPNSKQKTLVVQIRSDQPVPLVLKGRPHTHGHTHALTHSHAHVHPHHLTHAHVHHHINAGPAHLRSYQRPMKLTAAASYLKNPTFQRKPLKLTNTKAKLTSIHKPATSYEVPFKYEIPNTQTQSFSGELQQLPMNYHIDFISDHFAPIHTIPAPNLSIQDNHLHPEDTYIPPSSPKPQVYHQKKNNYQVNEDSTNDQTFVDPLSGSEKLIAPDPDPSLPAAPVRPSTESFNTPSNGKPLPIDIQTNHLTVAQPLVQIVGAQAAQQIAPEIYPIQYTQPFASIQAAAPIPIYNPTYLVQQSNNLYTQHKQQLFKPAVAVVEAGYVNADLTQQVASNGQILQAAKDPHNNIHPVLDVTPHFAPLIAAPSLDEEQSIHTAPFHLQNFASSNSAATGTTEAGFVVSNYHGNGHQDSSQLLQAYLEEEQAETQRQQYEQELQQQQQQQQQLEIQQLKQQQLEYQQLQQFHQQQQQQLLQQQQQQYASQQPQHQALVHQPRPKQKNNDPSVAAFKEHQRLVQQQLGADTPLRIFVPDEEEQRLQKRSDNILKGTIEDVENTAGVEEEQPQDELYEVSSSVEVTNEDQQQQQKRTEKVK